MMRTYLDWAASAPPLADVAEAATRIATETFGNPSSAHEEGNAAEAILAHSRESLAAVLRVPPETVFFTSGGTESNNLILTSLVARLAERGEIEKLQSGHARVTGHVVTSGIEHSSIFEPSLMLENLGFQVTRIPAETDGRVDPERVAEALRADTLAVSIMLVNNETGAVQPVEEIGRRIREYEKGKNRIHFHCDAVQALGKIPLDCGSLPVDSASFSAHKIGGLRGAGALYLRRAVSTLFRGGGQESGVRPGTENLPAIWAMGEAATRAKENLEEHRAHAHVVRGLLVEGLKQIGGARFVPEDAVSNEEHFSPFILSVAFPPLPGEVLVRILNDAGFALSTGSACSSKRKSDRRVLTNTGIAQDIARSAIRISIGHGTEERDIERFLWTLRKEIETWNVPLRA